MHPSRARKEWNGRLARLFCSPIDGRDARPPRAEALGLQFGHFWESKSGEILKILAVLKFFADFENPLRVMTGGNGAIIRPGP